MSDIEIVRQSYGRCIIYQQFFVDFYDAFINSSEEIKGMFKDTNMSKQYQFLRSGISYIISYADGSRTFSMKLDKLRDTHSEAQMNILPWMYDYWLSSLLDTVKIHDTESTQDTLASWESVMKKGIEKISIKPLN